MLHLSCAHRDRDTDKSSSARPANAEAAQLFRENMKDYIKRVRETVEDSWIDS